jgi:hypothetical protein
MGSVADSVAYRAALAGERPGAMRRNAPRYSQLHAPSRLFATFAARRSQSLP